jgi:flagellar biosynthesis/type III secretory pathway protein FliH
MTLALRRIDTGTLQPSDWTDGVLKAQTLASAGAARDLVERARADADRLLQAARTQAEQELQRRQDELQQQLWRNSAAYAQALQDEWSRALSDLEGRIAQLLARALRRMTAQVPSEERLRACVQQLIDEAGTPDGGVLLVSSEAHAAVRTMADDLPWPVQPGEDLPPGTVRLVSAHGRWECSLDSVIDQLAQALGTPGADMQEHRHA